MSKNVGLNLIVIFIFIVLVSLAIFYFDKYYIFGEDISLQPEDEPEINPNEDKCFEKKDSRGFGDFRIFDNHAFECMFPQGSEGWEGCKDDCEALGSNKLAEAEAEADRLCRDDLRSLRYGERSFSCSCYTCGEKLDDITPCRVYYSWDESELYEIEEENGVYGKCKVDVAAYSRGVLHWKCVGIRDTSCNGEDTLG